MKRRLRRVVNFFAFNLLFFALYLNFIHKDQSGQPATNQLAPATASVTSASPVTQPERYLDAKAVARDPHEGEAKTQAAN